MDSSPRTSKIGGGEEVLRVIDCVLGVASGTRESVQGSITGIKRRPVSPRDGKEKNSYPAWLSQGDALVASLARRSRVGFFVVLNWNRKRAVFTCFQSTLEYVKFC